MQEQIYSWIRHSTVKGSQRSYILILTFLFIFFSLYYPRSSAIVSLHHLSIAPISSRSSIPLSIPVLSWSIAASLYIDLAARLVSSD